MLNDLISFSLAPQDKLIIYQHVDKLFLHILVCIKQFMTSSWAGCSVPTRCSWTGSHMRAGGWGRYVGGDLSRQKTHRVSRSEVCSLDSGNGFPQSSHWKQTRFRQSSWGQQLLSDMFTQTMEGLFTVTESDLEDGTSCSFTPLLHDSWDLLHVLYVPQPDSPVLQRHRRPSTVMSQLLTCSWMHHRRGRIKSICDFHYSSITSKTSLILLQ